MKKSILIIAALFFGLVVTANATSLNTTPTISNATGIVKADIVEIFNWSVKTTVGNFSGTESTLASAERRVQLASEGLIVLEHIITSYYVLRNEQNKPESRMYFWEVQSENGRAKGFSTSEASANKMINLVSSGDVVYYRIIASSKIK